MRPTRAKETIGQLFLIFGLYLHPGISLSTVVIDGGVLRCAAAISRQPSVDLIGMSVFPVRSAMGKAECVHVRNVGILGAEGPRDVVFNGDILRIND